MNHKETLLKMIEGIESEIFLKFLCNLIESFKKTWGY
ncbi:Uncharacterised protein [uncultured Eubacterium sp.]|nr:Uncharacterised protein [uncultured Eubacterium sp.]